MVKRRYVFHIAGYDPIGAAWYRLFKRELAKFAQLWNVRATLSDLERSTREPNARWTVVTGAASGIGRGMAETFSAAWHGPRATGALWILTDMEDGRPPPVRQWHVHEVGTWY